MRCGRDAVRDTAASCPPPRRAHCEPFGARPGPTRLRGGRIAGYKRTSLSPPPSEVSLRPRPRSPPLPPAAEKGMEFAGAYKSP